MKRRTPQGWTERFAASLTTHTNNHLEEWRWARPGEEPCDPIAVEAAWDLVTLSASAEANMLNHAMGQMEEREQGVMLAALVVAAARRGDVGTLKVVAKNGKAWWPRDLSFVPGREHLEPEVVISAHVEVGRSIVDLLIEYTHVDYAKGTSKVRNMAVFCADHHERGVDREEAARGRSRDLELQQEGYIVMRFSRSDVWSDPIGCAIEAYSAAQMSAEMG